MSAIQISGISKSFGTTPVLGGVSIDIRDGEFVSLVGPSGCGKSTLLRIVAGLERQDSGSIRIGDARVDGTRASDRNLAMVFQSYALYPHLSVAENIALPLRMRQLSTLQRLPLVGRAFPGASARLRSIDDAVARAAEMLDIAHLLDRRPGQLSGGQRQRVALGRALVRSPEAFLLDEPLSNLDAKLRVHTRTEIAELHRRLEATFIYVTHDQAEAMTMSDRIAVMMDGEILQFATPDEIYNDPLDIRVAGFVGSPRMNILPAECGDDGMLRMMGSDLALRVRGAGGAVRLGVRPEVLEPTSGTGPVRGVVRHKENLGSEVFVQIEVEGNDDRVVMRLAPGEARSVSIGHALAATFDPARAVVFGRDGRRLGVEAVVPAIERRNRAHG
jgi:multiple sugar transport system ATP-binding protein